MSCGGAAVRAAVSTPRPQPSSLLLASRSGSGSRATCLPWTCAPQSRCPPMTLTVRRPRDLTENQLTTLPPAGLGGLMHLKLRGNPALSQPFSKDSFPKLR